MASETGHGDLRPITWPGPTGGSGDASSTASWTFSFRIPPPTPRGSHIAPSSGGDPAAPRSRPAGPFGPGTARGWAAAPPARGPCLPTRLRGPSQASRGGDGAQPGPRVRA